MGGSTEGPIYSTIDATSEDLHGFTYGQDMSIAPYASTSIMPFTNQTQAPAHGAEQTDDSHRIASLGPSGAQYAQPDRCTGESSSMFRPHYKTHQSKSTPGRGEKVTFFGGGNVFEKITARTCRATYSPKNTVLCNTRRGKWVPGGAVPSQRSDPCGGTGVTEWGNERKTSALNHSYFKAPFKFMRCIREIKPG